jgi:hypothetical protein
MDGYGFRWFRITTSEQHTLGEPADRSATSRRSRGSP